MYPPCASGSSGHTFLELLVEEEDRSTKVLCFVFPAVLGTKEIRRPATDVCTHAHPTASHPSRRVFLADYSRCLFSLSLSTHRRVE